MKILLDENLPLKLKNSFGDDHEIRSVREMGWSGKKNGELLGLMTLDGFDVLITMDKNLQNQQNLSRFPITIFILRGINNKLETLQELVSLVLATISKREVSGVVEIKKE